MRVRLMLLVLMSIGAAVPASASDSRTRDGDAPLLAGLATVDITPPIGVPLAGFGSRRIIPWDVFDKYPYCTFMKPSEGIIDPIHAKVMLLRRGDQNLLFISLDVIGSSTKMRDDIYHALWPMGFLKRDIFSATHTHSGPGTISDNPVWEFITMDTFLPEIYDKMMGDIVEGVKQAVAALEPASLYTYSFDAQGLQQNRRDHVGYFDPQTNVLLAKNAQGDWMGGLINIAIHGTALGQKNQSFSADVPGGFEREMESRLVGLNSNRVKQPTVVFINGAEGDVAPTDRGEDGIAALSHAFGDQAMAAMPQARPVNPDWSVYFANVRLGVPYLHPKACVKESWWTWLIADAWHVHLADWFPEVTRIWVIRLGDMLMMAWPGEPTTSLGLEMKALAKKEGASSAWVLGLTNDHLAYFLRPEEYEEGGYESCSSLYGPDAGEHMVNVYKYLVRHTLDQTTP